MRLLLPALLLLCAPAARAEGPVAPPAGGDPMEEIRKAAAKITEAMKASEEALTRVARGEAARPGTVDVDLPPPPGSSSSPSAASSSGSSSSGSSSSGASEGEGGGEALRGSGARGREVVEGINRIIESAAKMGGRSSGGGGGKPSSSGEDPGKPDGKEPRNGKKDQEPKGDPLKDNRPENGGDPKDGRKEPRPPESPKGKTPPPGSPLSPPGPREPGGVFFAQLPAKVREAVLAGDFDQVPERYRELIREWTRRLAEKEKERDGDAAK